jgi:hypothetical protein
MVFTIPTLALPRSGYLGIISALQLAPHVKHHTKLRIIRYFSNAFKIYPLVIELSASTSRMEKSFKEKVYKKYLPQSPPYMVV